MNRDKLLEILGQSFFTIRWDDEVGCIEIIDQRLIPCEVKYLKIRSVDHLCEAIRQMAIRGAPALGIAGGMGVALAIFEGKRKGVMDIEKFVVRSAEVIAAARPTAVNLSWGVGRVLRIWSKNRDVSLDERCEMVVREAEEILMEDIRLCRQMGKNGASLLSDEAVVMTICNAGALATGGGGTALSVFREVKRQSRKIKVYACETRPRLQGAKLTAWELMMDGIDVTLICDLSAGYIMSGEKLDGIFTGADRIALNGDTANKIGTYSLSILANYFSVPFYVVAPYSTFDFSVKSGSSIIIEERDRKEIIQIGEQLIAPEGVSVRNPAFDITPARNITRIITERGIFRPSEVKRLMGS